MSIQENVKEWVSVDNRIKSLNEQIQDLRGMRKEYEQSMVSWATQTPSGQKPVIKISDGKLRFVETKQTAPLTLKYVNERIYHCFTNIAGMSEQSASTLTEKIMEDLKVNREVKVIQEVKRIYDK